MQFFLNPAAKHTVDAPLRQPASMISPAPEYISRASQYKYANSSWHIIDGGITDGSECA